MAPPAHARASRAALAYAWGGAAAFALALLFFLYCLFVEFGRPARGPSILRPVLLNVGLFSVFALHHSAFARTALKARVAAMAGPALERSTYVWIASGLFALVCGLWQRVPGEVYTLEGVAAAAGYAAQAAGILLTARGSAALDVLDLAGVRPLLNPENRGAGALQTAGAYAIVRHPVYLAWALLVFGAPHMTGTRLVFAIVSTTYLVLAIPFEERALARTFGDQYAAYRRRVRWRMLPGLY